MLLCIDGFFFRFDVIFSQIKIANQKSVMYMKIRQFDNVTCKENVKEAVRHASFILFFKMER
jgi:hypothetical protein